MRKLVLALPLFLLFFSLGEPALTSDVEDFEEKQYCKYHGHFADCKSHRETNHCDYDKHKDFFDYRSSSVSASAVKNPSVQHFDIILPKLRKKISHYAKFHSKDYLKIDFSDNYLRDEGVQELCDFIVANKHLKKRLKKLNLRNNKITKASLPTLEGLITNLPKLKMVDISANHISPNEYEQFVKGKGIRKRIVFSVY